MDERCNQIEALLPAYALEALEVAERWQVEAHLQTCPECSAALEHYQDAALGLLMAAPEVEPPPRLRARIIASTAEPGPASSRSAGRSRNRVLFGLANALLAAFMLISGFLIVEVRELARDQAQLAEQLQEDQTVFGLYSYPTTVSVVVEGAQAYGTFLYEPNFPVSVLYAWGLDRLGTDSTYQVWLIEPGGGRVSGGLFQVGEDARFVRLLVRAPENISNYSAIGVTVEPAGGSAGPTGPKVLGADL